MSRVQQTKSEFSNPADRHGGSRAEGTDAKPSSESGEPISILIVDDEPKNLKVLETVLEDPGYRLVCAESGEQALLAACR